MGEIIYLILVFFTAGVLGTVVMDIMNLLFTRLGFIQKIEINIIGRMAAGWLRGRFLYDHPAEMETAANEVFIGYITHYSIGIALAIPYILFWDNVFGSPPSFYFTVAYGIATTAASWFFVYPTMGFGALGLKSPEGPKAAFSSLANHLFYGIGLAAGIAIM